MNLPPIFKSLKLYESLSYIVGGVLAILVLLGKVSPDQAWTPAAILAFVLGVLNALGIYPELRQRGIL